MYKKSICCLFLFSTSYIAATEQDARYRYTPEENIQIYNSYPPEYGYYGYPYVETPAEAFPDSAEANHLYNKMLNE